MKGEGRVQTLVTIAAFALMALAVAPAGAQAPRRPTDDAAVARDLTATIALQGKPCGQVVSVARRGDNDYMATCSDGNRYHVFVNAEGRVVVQKQ
jgi:hypothetical protein